MFIMQLLVIIIFSLFLKNLLKTYYKTRKKYNQMWKRDYVTIILEAISYTLKDIYIIINEVVKRIYWKYKFKGVEYNKGEIVDKIRLMTPREFEVFCANILNENKNYKKAQATDATCDGGKDVIATDRKYNTIYVECKHYKEHNNVGRPEVQKLIGACIGDKVNNAIFITTSDYSNEAREYAKRITWLELWTMEDILMAINKIEKKRIAYALNCIER